MAGKRREQHDSAVNEEIGERVDTVVERSSSASMESQEIRVKEEDAIEPVLARQYLIEDGMESVFQLPGRMNELETENERLQSANRTMEATINA